MTVDVVAVVVTHNSAHVVRDLLDSIPSASGGLDVAVVVVDNGSTDSTVDVVSPRKDCSIVRAANLGYAAGVNRGSAEYPGAPAILVLNPDVRLDPGSISEMANALETSATGIVAPRIREPDGRTFRSLRREPTLARAIGLGFTGWWQFSEYVSDMADYEVPHAVDWALGAVLLLKRTCFDQLGGMDESFFLYSEETDYCLRALDRGWITSYAPSAGAMHIGGQSGRSNSTHVMQIMNRVRLYSRRSGTLRSCLYYAATVLSEVSWALRGHRESVEAVRALISPARRPPEIGSSSSVIPT